MDTLPPRKGASKPRLKPVRISQVGLFKPYLFPPNFCLVIDTREQRPLFHPPPKGLVSKTDTLHSGDYSIYGLEDKVFLERKGISDLISYVSSDRKNTKAKLERIQSYPFKALVIESSWDDLFLPKFYSSISNEVIRQSLVSFQVKFGLHVFAHSYRPAIEQWILDRFIYFFKIIRS